MATERRAKTMQLSGNEYAKVAERLRLFRNDWPKSKQESAYEIDVDGTIVFTVWLWKDKNDLLDLMKAGVIDKDALRSSADANGNAKSSGAIVADPNASQATRVAKTKEFEKLESVALGRALAMLGYLASGEIASFEEMEEFEAFRKDQQAQAIQEAIESLNAAKTMDDLKKAFVATKMMEVPEVVAAKDKRKSELAKGAKAEPPKPTTTVKTPPQKPANPVETPTALPLDEGEAAKE